MANIYSLQLLRNGSPYASYDAAVAGIKASGTTDGTIKLARYYQEGASGNTKSAKYNTNGEIKTIFGIYNALLGEKAAGYTIFDATHEVLENIQAQIDSITGEGGSVAEQIKAAIDQLNYTGVTTGDGVVITNVTESSGVVSADSAEVGGLKLTNYALGSDSGAVAANDTINAALSKLQNQINKANEDSDEAIKALDGSIVAETGYYINKVDEVDGVISGTTAALPTVAAISSEGQAITAVSQSLGTVDASYGDIAAAHVTVADANSAFTATTVEDVLAEIDSAYKAADAAIVGDATTSGDTLGKLEDRIEALDADAKEYHIVKTTAGLPETIKERYSLVDAAGNVSGDTVDIPKDSHIESITYDGATQKLTYNYIDASGNTQSTDVDMSQMVLETEFGSGVTVTDHVAHGVVDPTSETFLTVGANGFKLAGVQGAINEANSAVDELSGKTVTGIDMTGGTAAIAAGDNGTKKITINTDGSQILATGYEKGTDKSAIAATDSINAALAKLENQVAAANATVQKDAAASHITLSSTTGSNGETVYTIGESDIASKSDLDAEIAARKAVDGQDGQTYTANANTNYISAATSLNDADIKLDAAIKALEGAAQTEIDAIETAVGLDANGGYVAGDGHYTSAATSVADAIDKLDDAVKDNTDGIAELSGKTITGITMNGTGVTVTNNVAALTASYTNTAAESENGMVITTDANGGLTFQFGTLDAGTY